MNQEFWPNFYKTFDGIIASLQKSFVVHKQKEYASDLNHNGIKLYLQKRYPEAKAYFRVAEMLGNYDAFQNFLAIQNQ